jgi:hypothetical protein
MNIKSKSKTNIRLETVLSHFSDVAPYTDPLHHVFVLRHLKATTTHLDSTRHQRVTHLENRRGIKNGDTSGNMFLLEA